LTLSFGGYFVCQKKGSKVQTTHPPNGKVKSIDNTSTKRQGQKNRQHIHEKTRSKVQSHSLLVDVLSVILILSFGGCICLYFYPSLLVDVLSVLLTLSFGGCIICTFDLVFSWMQSQKYRQHILQKKGSKEQTTHPPKDKVKSTDNTYTKRQGQKLTLSFGGCIVYTFDLAIWWMCCLYF
jgi:hypothetical protein